MSKVKIVLYKMKLGLIYLFNFLLLRKGFKSMSSPELLFLQQYQNGVLNRYDILIRYLFIDYLSGKNEFGRDIYIKMQKNRAGFDAKAETDYLKKESTLKNIVEKIGENGVQTFKPKPCIRLNKKNQLCDGSHRLAVGLYYHIPSLCFTKSQSRIVSFGLDDLVFLTNEEKDILKETEIFILKNINIKEILNEILLSQKQQFGRGIFYQTYEDLEIDGQRPTKKRFNIYGLKNILKKNMSVLDIGSNCGFFSLYISKFVKSVEGIEYNKSLTDISNITKLLLNVENVKFINADFNKLNLNRNYDLILSFAVHYWIGIEINTYANLLRDLLNDNGYVLFESQNIMKEDADWDLKNQAFISVGFIEVDSGELCDDGKIKRKFSLFQKT
jgi:16S rRNA G527 N7-methylase RsmG